MGEIEGICRGDVQGELREIFGGCGKGLEEIWTDLGELSGRCRGGLEKKSVISRRGTIGEVGDRAGGRMGHVGQGWGGGEADRYIGR